jgi:hypothetical protein
MDKPLPFFTFLFRLNFLLVFYLLNTQLSIAQNIDFGKSYKNITKGLNGGTVETGDTLEIRASFVVRSGTYDSCRYSDVIPAGTSYINGTIRVLTNEGKIYKQFTDAYGDDPGWKSGSNITINLGYNTSASPATAFRRGRVSNTDKPSFYGGNCIMIASFRVQVTAPIGSTISTGGGNMTYKSGKFAIQTFIFPSNTVMIYQNYGICSNTIGVNSIGTEFNGTFGSGKPRNRGTSGNVPVGYTYKNFTTNSPNDYSYGIANNTSTDVGYSTVNTWAYPDGSSPSHRVFGVWDIIGDHTGASNPYTGNPAADTVANSNAGYMLVINAAYRIDSAFQQTISGLCPNTYYEISCWMRNICLKCGCDSNGKGATNSSGPPYYIPSGPGDSSGVRPNLTFEVDGIDYYTSGDLVYTGLWEKKGFTYLTGPSQTSFTLKFFNNAPGGGGNDWALDDISVSTCSPNMKYSPSVNPTICDSNTISINDTVRSYFNNYVHYKWQRSTNGGSSWSDVTPPGGPAVPYWNGTDWEYVTTYNIPPSQTQVADSGDLYRVVVATTSSNLNDPYCRFTDQGNIITLHVIECGIPLSTQLLSFTGNINTSKAVLQWTTDGGQENLFFDIEKSIDGTNFSIIGTLNNSGHEFEQNNYSFTDPVSLNLRAYYRIKMYNATGKAKFSRTILLTLTKEPLSFLSVTNPFKQQLNFEVVAQKSGKSEVELIDISGNILRKAIFNLLNGINLLVIENTHDISAGLYFLKVRSGDATILKRVLKQY